MRAILLTKGTLFVYRRVIYPVFQRLDAERSHDLVLRLLGTVEQTAFVRRLVARLVRYDHPHLHTTCWGLEFPNPLGIAAGLDKNAVALQTWGALGFGHVEVGTITPQPQPGNPKPRVFRLPSDNALINRMGFPGQGALTVKRRLARPEQAGPIVGVNLGANKASVEAGRAAEDYVQGLEWLHEYADYLTINVSSPNTARLRDLQGRAALDALIGPVMQRRKEVAAGNPVLLKIAPDLSDAELDDILQVCLDNRVDGIIATNTTIARPPSLRGNFRAETGGLSGEPLRARSLNIIRYVYNQTAGKLPIVGVGGVFSAQDAWDKLAAGARLVQVYTGLIYEGPLLAGRINRQLVQLIDQHGMRAVAEVVGSAAGRDR